MSARLVIIGGVAGGASAATRARRMDEAAEITIFERSGHISFANCGLPYYIGEVIQDRAALLVTTPKRLWQQFRIRARTRHEVTAINRAQKTVTVKNLQNGEESQVPYDKLIIATGAAPIVPELPGADAENIFTLRSLEDADKIVTFMRQNSPKRALVIGAGYIGLEMVENLVQRGLRTTLVELMDQVLPLLDTEMTAPLLQTLTSNGVDVLLSQKVVALDQKDAQGNTLARLDGGSEIPYDICILSVGIKPELELAKAAGLQIGQAGGIAVDEYQRTSDPDIFAVGDACEYKHLVTSRPTRMPLAGPANKAGRVAGHNAVRPNDLIAFPGVLGTAIVRVFDQVAAFTGLTAKAADLAGIKYRFNYAVAPDHASYYPGARRMLIKLLWVPDTGRVLGAQIVGGAGVDKRIDVIATTIYLGGTVEDLGNLDLAYAPQFGSAKDAVNVAGFVADNVRRGLVEIVDPVEAIRATSEVQIVDVRPPGTPVPALLKRSTINIPMSQLRDQLDRLDRDRPVYTLCAVGRTAYMAARILAQSGFKDVRDITGGCTMLQAIDTVREHSDH